jgi:TolA-binding protein
LRDEVVNGKTAELADDQNIQIESEDSKNDKIAEIEEFEKLLQEAKVNKVEKLNTQKPINIAQTSKEPVINEELAVAGVPSRDDVQDETLEAHQRRLLTFKEQFDSFENRHDKLKMKVEQIEEELKFLRGQVIALNSRKETFIAESKPSNKESTTIIQSDEKLNATADIQQSIESKDDTKEKMILAEQFYDKGKYRDAIGEYSNLLKTAKDVKSKSEANYKIAMCHYHLKEYEKSIQYYNAVCAISGDLYKDDAKIHIAEANMKLGKIDEAKKAYQNVLAEYPRSKHIPKARKMLQQL